MEFILRVSVSIRTLCIFSGFFQLIISDDFFLKLPITADFDFAIFGFNILYSALVHRQHFAQILLIKLLNVLFIFVLRYKRCFQPILSPFTNDKILPTTLAVALILVNETMKHKSHNLSPSLPVTI